MKDLNYKSIVTWLAILLVVWWLTSQISVGSRSINFVVAFFVANFYYYIDSLVKNLEKLRKAYLTTIFVELNLETIAKDFFKGGEAKKILKNDTLSKPIVFGVYRDLWDSSVLVFNQSSFNPHYTIWAKYPIKEKSGKEKAKEFWFYVEDGNLLCELVKEELSLDEDQLREVFSFPFYLIENFFIKITNDYTQFPIKKFPSFLEGALKSHDFEILNFLVGGEKTHTAFGSEWIDEENDHISYDPERYKFNSKYATISINTVAFQGNELSLFDLILNYSGTTAWDEAAKKQKGKIKYNKYDLVKKINVLKEADTKLN